MTLKEQVGRSHGEVTKTQCSSELSEAIVRPSSKLTVWCAMHLRMRRETVKSRVIAADNRDRKLFILGVPHYDT